MGDKNEPTEESVMNIFNDLAKGQQQLVQLMQQMITSQQVNKKNGGNNGDRGSNSNGGNHAKASRARIPLQRNTQTASKVAALTPVFGQANNRTTGTTGATGPG